MVTTPHYFDFAAATPVDPQVLASMQPYLSTEFYNPSAIYLAGRAVRDALNQARHEVAIELGARPGEIVFTAGATEANNLAITGVMKQFPEAKLLVSTVEHASVSEVAKQFNGGTFPVDQFGVVKLPELIGVVTDDVVLISLIYANNELGTIQPLREVADLIQTIRNDRQERGVELPLYLHSDAAQAANYLDLHVARLGVDLMTISAGKTYGPKQVGCLFVRAGIRLQPLINGGGQEFGLRSGTENVAGAMGLAKALHIAGKKKKTETERLKALQGHILDRLTNNLPDFVLHGHPHHRLPNHISGSLPGVDGESVVMMLDERGIQAATGAACGASKEGPSAVLLATGVDANTAEHSIRLTMGRTTTQGDVDYLIEQLLDIASRYGT